MASEDPFGERLMQASYAGPNRQDNGINVLITAGPTREPIDVVRHISNMSTGRLGVEIAREAFRRDYNVLLLYGQGTAKVPPYIRTERFTTTQSLLTKVLQELPRTDIFISSAAVSDYAPVPLDEKISSDKDELSIQLRPTPKVIKEAKKAARLDTRFVAFKLGYKMKESDLIEQAIASYGSVADLIVCNDLADITEERHPAIVLYKGQVVSRVEYKSHIAKAIFDTLEKKPIRIF